MPRSPGGDRRPPDCARDRPQQLDTWLAGRSVWSSRVYESPAGAFVRVVSYPDGQAERFIL
ncbi:MAG: hypothetical protein HY319_06410 [Armatimonadetes bacterium]|nr:hypothetical protein [Armatimonadota bacterium]